MSTETQTFEKLLPESTTLSAVKATLDALGEKKMIAFVRATATQVLAVFSWDTPTQKQVSFASSFNPSLVKLFMPNRVSMVIRKDGLNDLVEKHGDLPCFVFYIESN
jgi:hypothetical protein